MIREPELEVVSIADSALDVPAMAGTIGKYMETRDRSLVREKPGMKCTRFIIGDIPSSTFWNVVMASPVHMQAFNAFRYGVRRIENLKRRDGSLAEVAHPDVPGTDLSRTPYWSEGKLHELPPVYVGEIGGLAFARAFFAEDDVGSWPPPPLSQAVLNHQYLRHADAILEQLPPEDRTRFERWVAGATFKGIVSGQPGAATVREALGQSE